MNAALRLITAADDSGPGDSLTVPDARLARPNDLTVTWAADDAGLSQSEHRLFARMYRRYNLQRGCDESIPAMAEACRMSAETARAARTKLVARGMIRETPRTGRPSRFDVLDPAGWLSAEEVPTPPKRTPTLKPTPPKRGEGYPPQMRGDEVFPEVNPDEEDADERARETGPGGASLDLEALCEHSGSFRAHRREIADTLASLAANASWREGPALTLLTRALKAGGTPAASIVRAAETATARLGLPAVVGALVVTQRCADPKSRHQARLSYLKTIIADLDDHARALHYAGLDDGAGPDHAAAARTGSHAGAAAGLQRAAAEAPSRAGRGPSGAAGAAPGQAAGRGAGASRVTGTAAQRASTVNARDLLAGLDEHRRRRGAAGGDGHGDGGGRDDGGDG